MNEDSTEMLALNDDERRWLEQYRLQLHRLYPGLIQDLVVFGSKARGESRQDSDLDLMVVIRDGDKAIKKDIAFLAYDLAVGTQAVPSIVVYTDAEKNQRIEQGISFMDSVQREGLSVR
ncbi:MAG: nucleotidyltransferase domain-containing protein [bacterium]